MLGRCEGMNPILSLVGLYLLPLRPVCSRYLRCSSRLLAADLGVQCILIVFVGGVFLCGFFPWCGCAECLHGLSFILSEKSEAMEDGLATLEEILEVFDRVQPLQAMLVGRGGLAMVACLVR